MEQKRELIYEISKWPEGASEMLQSWSRQEILQILCAELGKERKYTGLIKSKLIENLLKIVCEKRSLESGNANISEVQPSSENGERTPKRQRKSDHPNRLPFSANGGADIDSGNAMHCKNSACKAKMNHEDVFCKRCSCCICHQYDDNKDPSLWLSCNSDAPFRGLSCGMSCHLECALRHENSGISQDKGLDGSFCCVSCGKVNDLLSCWRKQVVVAKETRRVDILCYRLSLSQKILLGTKHYQHLYNIIDEAVKKLEQDVGPLTGLPVKKARGIVNRLSSGPEIQRHCASALDMLSNRLSDMPSGCNILGSKLVKFEDICASSLMVILNSEESNMGNVDGYMLWHRRADDTVYSAEPSCRLFQPNTKFLLSGLTPATHYVLKVVALVSDREAGFGEFRFQTGSSQDEVPNSKTMQEKRIQSPVTNCSRDNEIRCDTTNSNSNSNISDLSQKETMIAGKKTSCISKTDKKESSNTENGCKQKGMDAEPQAGSSSKKRKEQCTGIGDKELEYYVKVIRWLECEGHVEASFRQKFLTWYSLRATPQEVRIVKAFIDTLVEDPQSLAGQLLDSFSDVVSKERCWRVRAGFCTKLWH